MFIYVFSLTFQSSVSLNIHNRCQDINMISPVYFTRGGRWYEEPDQEIGVNAVMRNYLEFYSGRNILEGALIYKIQREHDESDKFTQDESKCIQLLVAWHIENTKELHVCALLVEHDRKLDEDKLMGLYQKHWHSLKSQIDLVERNWLLHDAEVLTMTVKTMNEDHRWDIFITKGVKDNVKRPLWINAKR
jgi:hypothetical protein